jgi:hypothetical protein
MQPDIYSRANQAPASELESMFRQIFPTHDLPAQPYTVVNCLSEVGLHLDFDPGANHALLVFPHGEDPGGEERGDNVEETTVSDYFGLQQ